jgi:hypothetical protein
MLWHDGWEAGIAKCVELSMLSYGAENTCPRQKTRNSRGTMEALFSMRPKVRVYSEDTSRDDREKLPLSNERNGLKAARIVR